MSDILDKAVAALEKKLGGVAFGAVVAFDIENEGIIFVDGTRDPAVVATAGPEASVTIGASKETFQKIVAGEMNPIAAAMSGEMKIDGDIGAAMKLAESLG